MNLWQYQFPILYRPQLSQCSHRHIHQLAQFRDCPTLNNQVQVSNPSILQQDQDYQNESWPSSYHHPPQRLHRNGRLYYGKVHAQLRRHLSQDCPPDCSQSNT